FFMTITSHHNQKLKEIRKLRQRRRWRERSGLFVAEGEDLLTVADAHGWIAIERYAAAGSGLPGVEVSAELLAGASGLGSGTRTLAVYQERWAPAPAGPLCMYLHGVHDPGNVGAVLRSAHAFGASSVALGPGTADPFGPKAVRASMGAVFSVPLVKDQSVADLPGVKIALVAGRGSELWRIGSGGRNQSDEVRGRGCGREGELQERANDIAILIGSEREGLPEDLIQQADHTAQIPIHTDSLNAAM